MSASDITIRQASSAKESAKKVRLAGLTALVIGSMVGSGVFSLPQNMAAGAGPLAVAEIEIRHRGGREHEHQQPDLCQCAEYREGAGDE